ncbi:MAG: O-antigen ligase family protein [Myxococcaceae bacterium]|nr:O-antigen ligase family protein [Myxococcaceae bacterium]MCI0672843.1 O-antigen ligase family protein [Myxococcaceae bacterium]
MEGGQARTRGDSVAFGALVLFSGVMYAAPGEWLPALAPLRLALASSALAFGWMLLTCVGTRTALSIDGAHGWALVLFALLTAVSGAWSIFPEGSREVAIDCAKYVAIYVTILNVVRTPERLRVLCGAIVVASLVTSVGVIDWYLDGVDLVEGFRARWVGIYADPNRMAMSLSLVVPLAVAFLLRAGTGALMKGLAALAAGLAITAVVLSHSRGGFIGLSIGMALWALSERRVSRLVVLGIAVLGLVAFAPSSFWDRTESVGDFREDASAMGRVHAWEVASHISREHPLLGVGAGSFRVAWPLYAPPDAVGVLEAHNIFLQVVAELGWVGLLLFLVFIGGAVEAGVRAWRDDEGRAGADSVAWLARALVCGAAGYLICNLFSGFLSGSPHFYVLFGLTAAAGAIARSRQVRELDMVTAPQ